MKELLLKHFGYDGPMPPSREDEIAEELAKVKRDLEEARKELREKQRGAVQSPSSRPSKLQAYLEDNLLNFSPHKNPFEEEAYKEAQKKIDNIYYVTKPKGQAYSDFINDLDDELDKTDTSDNSR